VGTRFLPGSRTLVPARPLRRIAAVRPVTHGRNYRAPSVGRRLAAGSPGAVDTRFEALGPGYGRGYVERRTTFVGRILALRTMNRLGAVL